MKQNTRNIQAFLLQHQDKQPELQYIMNLIPTSKCEKECEGYCASDDSSYVTGQGLHPNRGTIVGA